ncbi:hypothetical protein PCORN_11097 [Listeria cornellensis FSL F6-0969]|uniref:Uncharacterized protein n=1 Tax=Listeria cornellensis FSL F6-0969 TaxID=1265820 RepID=W7BV92_9LIST|nr:hypothetical protein PCORN_11097 [Listeria cornellensis FSL F6-0969]
MKKSMWILLISLFVVFSFVDIMLLMNTKVSDILGALFLGAIQSLIVFAGVLIIILLVKMIKKIYDKLIIS